MPGNIAAAEFLPVGEKIILPAGDLEYFYHKYDCTEADLWQ